MRLILIRHAQTSINASGNMHVRNDACELNEVGTDQADKLAASLKDLPVDVIYSSPELRAVRTAERIAEDMKIEQKILHEITERDWGEWSSMSWLQIEQKLEEKSLDDRYSFSPPGGESWQEMDARLEAALDHLASQDHKVVVIVTHGGALRALVPILKQDPKHSSFSYKFENASISTFEGEHGNWKEVTINNTSHLGH